MTRIHLVVAAFAAVLLLHGLPAAAETFNFGEFGEPANDGEQSVEGTQFTDVGITPGSTSELAVVTTAFILGGGTAEAYLDGPTGNGRAGLGVCKDVDGDQCDPSSDDNLTAGEVLKLTFSEEVDLFEMAFRNADHLDDFVFDGGGIADFGVAVDSLPTVVGDFTAFSITSNPFSFGTPLRGTEFYFVSDGTLNGRSGAQSELYINNMSARPVPEPRTTILFGAGLVFMAWWRLSNEPRRATAA